MSTTVTPLSEAEYRAIVLRTALEGIISSMKGSTETDRAHVAEKLRDAATLLQMAAEWVEDAGPMGGDAWQTPPYLLRVQKNQEQPGNPALGGPGLIDDFLIGVEVKLERVVVEAVEAFRVFRQTRKVRVEVQKAARRGLDAAQDQPGLLSAQDQVNEPED